MPYNKRTDHLREMDRLLSGDAHPSLRLARAGFAATSPITKPSSRCSPPPGRHLEPAELGPYIPGDEPGIDAEVAPLIQRVLCGMRLVRAMLNGGAAHDAAALADQMVGEAWFISSHHPVPNPVDGSPDMYDDDCELLCALEMRVLAQVTSAEISNERAMYSKATKTLNTLLRYHEEWRTCGKVTDWHAGPSCDREYYSAAEYFGHAPTTVPMYVTKARLDALAERVAV